MMAAHELVELFCELITARLPIIDAQKYVVRSILKFFDHVIVLKGYDQLITILNL